MCECHNKWLWVLTALLEYIDQIPDLQPNHSIASHDAILMYISNSTAEDKQPFY